MSTIKIKDKDFELFIPEKDILSAVQKTAGRINEDLCDKNPLFICVLNGAFIFAADLMKNLDFPCEITFIRLKSYEGTSSTQNIKEVQGLIEDISGRNVVIIEDVVDRGFTIKNLVENLSAKKPASLKIVAFLSKPAAMQTNIALDYVALEIPDDFIVGYGLDYDGHGRNLRNIYKLKS